jgi:hypothetical protein
MWSLRPRGGSRRASQAPRLPRLGAPDASTPAHSDTARAVMSDIRPPSHGHLREATHRTAHCAPCSRAAPTPRCRPAGASRPPRLSRRTGTRSCAVVPASLTRCLSLPSGAAAASEVEDEGPEDQVGPTLGRRAEFLGPNRARPPSRDARKRRYGSPRRKVCGVDAPTRPRRGAGAADRGPGLMVIPMSRRRPGRATSFRAANPTAPLVRQPRAAAAGRRRRRSIPAPRHTPDRFEKCFGGRTSRPARAGRSRSR